MGMCDRYAKQRMISLHARCRIHMKSRLRCPLMHALMLTSSTLFMDSHSSVYSIIGTFTSGSSTLGRWTVIGLNL